MKRVLVCQTGLKLSWEVNECKALPGVAPHQPPHQRVQRLPSRSVAGLERRLDGPPPPPSVRERRWSPT